MPGPAHSGKNRCRVKLHVVDFPRQGEAKEMMQHNIRLLIMGCMWLVLCLPRASGQDTRWEEYTAAGKDALTQGDYAEAEKMLLSALQVAQTISQQDPLVTLSLHNLGRLYYAQGKYAMAAPLYRRLLAIAEKGSGARASLGVAQRLANLADIYRLQSKFAEAEPLYQRSLAIIEKTAGPDHPELALSLNNLATLYYERGYYHKAEPLYQRSLAILEKIVGPDHQHVALSLNNLAGLYFARRNYIAAEPLYRRLLAILEKTLGPEHPNVALALGSYAALLRATNRGEEAAKLDARAEAIQAKSNQ